MGISGRLLEGETVMAIDFHEIELTEEQKRWLAELAEETGRPWRDILDESLGTESNGKKSILPTEDPYINNPDEWREYFGVFLAQQTSHNPNFDDSRESIYP